VLVDGKNFDVGIMSCSYNLVEPPLHCITYHQAVGRAQSSNSQLLVVPVIHKSALQESSVIPCKLDLQPRHRSWKVGCSVGRLRLTDIVYTVYLHSQEDSDLISAHETRRRNP
jgi:hypothetical protein